MSDFFVKYKWVPVIDATTCNGCQECIYACKLHSMEIVDGIAALVRPDTCGSEEHCIAPCPVGAIHMDWVAMVGEETRGKWRS